MKLPYPGSGIHNQYLAVKFEIDFKDDLKSSFCSEIKRSQVESGIMLSILALDCEEENTLWQ